MKLRIALAVLALAGLTGAAGAQDVDKGAVVFKKCAACHNVDNDKNKVGPHLLNLVGRKVAAVEGYKYSNGMVEFGTTHEVWDEALLTTYLEKPKEMVKGTKMAFVGLKKPEEIADLIAFMKSKATQ